MKDNPLIQLEKFGQSVWLDFINRNLIKSGELRKLIENDGLSGLTSNPAIFEKAISGSPDYDDEIRILSQEGKDSKAIYEAIMVKDLQMAADEFRPLYDKTDGNDGYVSLEVNPHLAHDTQGSIEEARRLWAALNRPNAFIKIPATTEGIPAIRQLISEGININTTLLFGLPRYRQVTQAYIEGMEKLASKGKPLKNIAAVASFFLSRIDTLSDPLEEQFLSSHGEQTGFTAKMKGQLAIASARLAYQMYKEIFASEPFTYLANRGARPQKLLWASTSTKNPEYSDVKYVDTLIGKNTINTMPPETIDAYRDHGQPEARLELELEQAQGLLNMLPELGIDINGITQQLEDEGVDKFNKQFDLIMQTLDKARANLHP